MKVGRGLRERKGRRRVSSKESREDDELDDSISVDFGRLSSRSWRIEVSRRQREDGSWKKRRKDERRNRIKGGRREGRLRNQGLKAIAGVSSFLSTLCSLNLGPKAA